MEIMDSETTSTILTSSRRRMPNSLQNQEGVLREKLSSLRQSHGYVATMTKVCFQVENLLVDCLSTSSTKPCSNFAAFENYKYNISRPKDLLAGDSVELQEIYGLYEAQEVRKSLYDSKIERYTIDAVSHFNKQVSEDLTRDKSSSSRGSVRSQSSRASRLSAASARLWQAAFIFQSVQVKFIILLMVL